MPPENEERRPHEETGAQDVVDRDETSVRRSGASPEALDVLRRVGRGDLVLYMCPVCEVRFTAPAQSVVCSPIPRALSYYLEPPWRIKIADAQVCPECDECPQLQTLVADVRRRFGQELSAAAAIDAAEAIRLVDGYTAAQLRDPVVGQRLPHLEHQTLDELYTPEAEAEC